MNQPHQPHRLLRVVVWVVACFMTGSVIGENEPVVIAKIESVLFPGLEQRFEAADSEGVTATRYEATLYLKVDADVKGPIKIPRLAAALVDMAWQGNRADDGISLKPEPDHWVISWKKRPAQDATLILQFGSEPLLLEELKPINKTGDGSFYLPAHLATTRGKKIRYEPQTFKNTVGFWAGTDDSAHWTIQLDKPGRFNVAVLQGCGKGQGGSEAQMSFVTADKKSSPTIEFEVVETGHWQNFQWIRLGEVELQQPGEAQIVVSPKKIKKGALMDIRAIHLIRLPDKNR
ncbi:MAG: hypothetical protein AAGI37_01165 [Planctomycetota bacterium]